MCNIVYFLYGDFPQYTVYRHCNSNSFLLLDGISEEDVEEVEDEFLRKAILNAPIEKFNSLDQLDLMYLGSGLGDIGETPTHYFLRKVDAGGYEIRYGKSGVVKFVVDNNGNAMRPFDEYAEYSFYDNKIKVVNKVDRLEVTWLKDRIKEYVFTYNIFTKEANIQPFNDPRVAAALKVVLSKMTSLKMVFQFNEELNSFVPATL